MNNPTSKSLSLSLEPLKRILGVVLYHHKIIAFTAAMVILIYCIYSIQNNFTIPSDEAYETEQRTKNTKTSFDKVTINQVNRLRTSDDPTPIVLPEGRINPFKE